MPQSAPSSAGRTARTHVKTTAPALRSSSGPARMTCSSPRNGTPYWTCRRRAAARKLRSSGLASAQVPSKALLLRRSSSCRSVVNTKRRRADWRMTGRPPSAEPVTRRAAISRARAVRRWRKRRAGVSLSLSFSGRTARHRRHRAAGGAARSARREGPRPTATGRNAGARRRSCAASARRTPPGRGTWGGSCDAACLPEAAARRPYLVAAVYSLGVYP